MTLKATMEVMNETEWEKQKLDGIFGNILLGEEVLGVSQNSAFAEVRRNSPGPSPCENPSLIFAHECHILWEFSEEGGGHFPTTYQRCVYRR